VKLDWLWREWPVKIVSLLVACVVWLYGRSLRFVERDVSLPLYVRHAPVSLAVYGDIPDRVRITVRGEKEKVEGVRIEEMTAELDLERAKEGRAEFEVIVSENVLPAGVVIRRKMPGRIAVHLEAFAERVVPVVRPPTVNLPAAGYKLADVSVGPQEVRIRGPRSVVTNLREVSPEIVNLAGVSENFEREVRLALPATVEAVGNPIFTVSARVKRDVAERVVREVPVEMRGLAPGLAARNDGYFIAVSVRGFRHRVAKVTRKDISAYVDLSEVKTKGSYRVDAKVVLPDEFEFLAATPEWFVVEVEEAP
jgi:YbbR domain-containing protein